MLLSRNSAFGQDTTISVCFDFNNHSFTEKNNKLIIKPVGVTLTSDRFGNKQSAVHVLGHSSSYLNLGISPLLKPVKGTLSFWVNLDRAVVSGRGFENNSMLITKNSTREDFFDAYAIAYELYNKKLCAASSLDSTFDVNVQSIDDFQFGKWYHVVLVFDDNFFALYLNGQLQQQVRKNFRTVYNPLDSVLVGHTGSKKNERFAQGVFDDIQIFHRVLKEHEIRELYDMPNPNKTSLIIEQVLKIGGIVALIIITSFALSFNRKKSLQKQEEKYLLSMKINEMEMKVIKAQMNPHFIFNSLNSIQQFVISNQNENARYYLVKFSKLLRELLVSGTKDEILLKDEINILTNYIEIEALRFSNVFKYLVSVDERLSIQDITLPHMMIQPFVENAIWHGLLPKKGSKNLSIMFNYKDERTINCIIDDDGVGRTATQAAWDESYSLATSFIRQRLELMSKLTGRKFTLKIIDKFDEQNKSLGTTVIVTLPTNTKYYAQSYNN